MCDILHMIAPDVAPLKPILVISSKFDCVNMTINDSNADITIFANFRLKESWAADQLTAILYVFLTHAVGED